MPNFVEPRITDLNSIIVYEDANEPYLEFVQLNLDENEEGEMSI